jgi:phosphoribosyl-ATP pyrophosphohydrolase
VGEDCSEVIIAAKNRKNEETTSEICDLIYHLLVLMAEQEIGLESVLAELRSAGGSRGT